MSSYRELQIKCNKEQKALLERIISKSDRDFETDWHLIIEEDSPLFNQALTHFIGLIESNLSTLNDIGIETNQITFWYMYEYVEQCNMEFWPEITRKLGELEIVLCISCWEK